MKKTAILILLGCLAVILEGCLVSYPMMGPPGERVEVIGSAPGGGFIWISGYWRWSGRDYVWARGYWARQRPGYAWVPGRWEQRGRRWEYRKGEWRREQRERRR